MKALLREIDDKLTEAELDAAIDEIDEDGSGKIEFEGIYLLIRLFVIILYLIEYFSEFFELMAGE